MKVLSGADQITPEVRKILSSSDRKVALVAYVGYAARDYVPAPNGLEIVCNPEPGATDARALKLLERDGAKISFCDNLHTKIFWAHGSKCFIGSANLTQNALGDGGLFEAGVLLDAKEVDIDAIIRRLQIYPAEPKHYQKLEDQARAQPDRRSGELGGKRSYSKPKYPTFKECEEVGFVDWKIRFYEVETEASKVVDEEVAKSGKLDSISERMSFGKNVVKPRDWVLIFEISPTGKVKLGSFDWFFCEGCVELNPDDPTYDETQPIECYQFEKKNRPMIPFELTPAIKKAVKVAVEEWGVENFRSYSMGNPTQRILKKMRLVSE